MSKVSKQRKEALAKFDKSKSYSLSEAVDIVKQITYTKFDASIDLNIRLGVDPRKANQMVRGSVTLPHGTGKVVRVLVLCNPDKAQEALDAGADYVGLDEYIQKIKDGWTDIDVVITTPNIMPKVGALGRILGPRGLMPNPKTGTVTMDVAKAVQEVRPVRSTSRSTSTASLQPESLRSASLPKRLWITLGNLSKPLSN